MKAILHFCLVCVTASILGAFVASADTLLFANGRSVSGTVIQTNGDEILLLSPYGAYNYPRGHIKEIKIENENAAHFASTNRLSDFKSAILILSKQDWATSITPIPATVIDKGILKNVPYSSFQCGENYEVNIYGDLDHPAGIEIGIYKALADDKRRQSNCVQFIYDLLTEEVDKKIVQSLDPLKDLKTRDDLSFEITPPSADDSYNGWWVSVYSEKQLTLARASSVEMKNITVSKLDAAKQSNQGDPLQWSAGELKLARNSAPNTLTFTNKDYEVISNATVRVYEPGVSIIWDKGSSGGLVLLADLPQDLQDRFGYDPDKAKAAEASKKEKERRWQQVLAAQAAQLSQQAQANESFDDSTFPSSGNYSGGGPVYVHGYTRSDGTYVNAYTRSR